MLVAGVLVLGGIVSQWSNPAEVLSSVSLTGGALPPPNPSPGTPVTSTVVDYERVMAQHFLEADLSSFSGLGVVVITLQGSLDGVNWYTIGSSGFSAPGVATLGPSVLPAQYVQVVAVAETEGSGPVVSATGLNASVIASETV
jgi:hypothetical protein